MRILLPMNLLAFCLLILTLLSGCSPHLVPFDEDEDSPVPIAAAGEQRGLP